MARKRNKEFVQSLEPDEDPFEDEGSSKTAPSKQAVEDAWKAIKSTLSGQGEKPARANPQGIRWQWSGYRTEDSDYVLIDERENFLWTIHYNGRDGDSWMHSNWQDRIATLFVLTTELREHLITLGVLFVD